MAYLLDTDICIYIIKKQPVSVREKFNSTDPTKIFVSSITVAELEYGVSKSSQVDQNSNSLKHFLSQLNIVSFDAHAATHYGVIRASLEKNGTLIGSLDMMIAAIAKSVDYILITNNEREFARVDGLKIENWIRE